MGVTGQVTISPYSTDMLSALSKRSKLLSQDAHEAVFTCTGARKLMAKKGLSDTMVNLPH
jgi:hypothetical protein